MLSPTIKNANLMEEMTKNPLFTENAFEKMNNELWLELNSSLGYPIDLGEKSPTQEKLEEMALKKETTEEQFEEFKTYIDRNEQEIKEYYEPYYMFFRDELNEEEEKILDNFLIMAYRHNLWIALYREHIN